MIEKYSLKNTVAFPVLCSAIMDGSRQSFICSVAPVTRMQTTTGASSKARRGLICVLDTYQIDKCPITYLCMIM